MGVHGLWKLLESTGKPINPETLEGKILAVDISIWLNQAVKGVRDREGNSVQNAHLLTLFHRICKLLFFRIRPVFVFDGDAPLLKKQTLATRRQRKEELNRESKNTNEKLLKTFLKRQAIKAALGDQSKDPLPSIASSGKDVVDDIYVLPALPPAEEDDRNSSEEEEEKELEEMADRYFTYQEELYEDPNAVDINSEEFASLPPEMKHEILKDMKELAKRRRTMYHKPPEHSGDFSQYQLAGLLHRNRLNQRLENVEREMSQRSAGDAPQQYGQTEDQGSHSVESKRLVSEDSAHYILIKGSSRPNDKAPDNQPASLPWSGGPLSGHRRQGADKPKPLWQPICEEDVLVGPSSFPKPSVLKLSPPHKEDTSPPSPRTLKAIQNAMAESSDEEEEMLKKRDGSVSPRTHLAIQQALAEEEDSITESTTPIVRPPTKSHIPSPAPCLVISTSEEEKEADDPPFVNSPAKQSSSGVRRTISEQSVCVKDGLMASSSEDEFEDLIVQKNRSFHSAILEHVPGQSDREAKTESEREAQMKFDEHAKQRGSTGTDLAVGIGIKREGAKQETELRHGWNEEGLKCDQDDHLVRVASEQRPLSINSPLPAPSAFLNAELKTQPHPTLSEQRIEESLEIMDKNGEAFQMAPTAESDSDESFIEVSEEEELQGELESSSLRKVNSEEFPPDVSDDTNEEEDKIETLTESLGEEEEEKREKTEEKELNEATEIESSATPANAREWEHFDVDELETLESSLEVQQERLREQKQQQERMAATVTGQMCLESQELLRLFGVPFLVAPTEAEAQCAALDRVDQTHGTITDDSDIWLFGGRHVYKNFFSQNKYVEHYQFIDLQNQLGLDRTKLINLAYLLGSDYTEGVPGVGYVTGMEILNEFPGAGLEPLTQFSEWWSEAQHNKRLASDPRDSKVKKKLRGLQLQAGFPNPAVAQAYMHPAVDQSSDGSFSWGRPHLDLIKEFCQSRFGWSSKRTEETLLPVLKQLNTQQTQLRIDSFFRMEQQEKQAIRSQRLRRAVTCLKRKEREGGGNEEEEEEREEAETPSPSKYKKRRASGQNQKKDGVEEAGARIPVGGGFLGSEVIIPSQAGSPKEVISVSQLDTEDVPQPAAPLQKARLGSSSSSCSGEDSEGSGEVAMVTAQSVFESKRRARGGGRRAGGSGRGRARGRGRKL
ncbi:DNA excision repair protein ERCC-5 homolog [Lampris incognitus]|uniref:DNA excision repair protein ERCC-5 homolog n=1 Tax=Lampris incognitus TaxID=2546036 RepID=UPI0024B5BF51|nr:DNA excision repair protein ERCC-5 homolog [Lampris incognitus]